MLYELYIIICWLCLYIYIISIFMMVKLSVYPCSHDTSPKTPLPHVIRATEMSPFKTSLTSPTWYGSGDGNDVTGIRWFPKMGDPQNGWFISWENLVLSDLKWMVPKIRSRTGFIIASGY